MNSLRFWRWGAVPSALSRAAGQTERSIRLKREQAGRYLVGRVVAFVEYRPLVLRGLPVGA